MLLKKTSHEMEAEAIQELLRSGLITNLSPGSRARAFVAVMSKQSGRLMDALDANIGMRFATSARGYFLDLIGQPLGVDREDASSPFVLKEDKAVKFYVTSGLLKDRITAGFIPSGTSIQTSDGGIQYIVPENTVFPDDAAETFVSATAVTSGSESRVGAGVLVVNSLGDANVFVTNDKPISNGGDQEDDVNYRYRIVNQWANKATANEAAVRLAVLVTPGVSDVILRPYFQGPGTMDVLITPIGNRVTEAMIVGAQARATRVAAAGARVTVRGPKYVPIYLKVRIDFTRDTPDTDKPGVRSDVRRALIDYLSDITMGSSLILQELRARVQQASEAILDHEILCFGIDGQPQMLRNWKLFDDELFLPNPDLPNPIEVV